MTGMFHHIPEPIRRRMAYLEEIDARDRVDGTPHSQRLRQVPQETGRFLAFLAAGAPEGAILEIGASAGYSSLWLALACMSRGRELTTFEILPDKARLARETFELAQVGAYVRLIEGDARHALGNYREIAFCFLDAEKDIYQACYELVIPKLVPGGLFIADNVISHQQALQPLLDRVFADLRVDALVVPVGKGLLICRRC